MCLAPDSLEGVKGKPKGETLRSLSFAGPSRELERAAGDSSKGCPVILASLFSRGTPPRKKGTRALRGDLVGRRDWTLCPQDPPLHRFWCNISISKAPLRAEPVWSAFRANTCKPKEIRRYGGRRKPWQSGKPLCVGNWGIIVLGFLRWCEVEPFATIHSITELGSTNC